MNLFDNQNYFQYIIFILLTLLTGNHFLVKCVNINKNTNICVSLISLSFIVIFTILISSLIYTNDKNNMIEKKNKIVRNMTDIILLIIMINIFVSNIVNIIYFKKLP